MGLVEAIKSCFRKYFVFKGRAARSEYWYFVLFILLASVALAIVEMILFPELPVNAFHPLSDIFSLLILIPSISLGARRLHDIDKSGWWQLLGIIPIIGWIVLIVWAIRKGTAGDNRFGPDPL